MVASTMPWKASDRAALETRLRAAPIADRVESCRVELLPRCTIPGSYRYSTVTPKTQQKHLRSLQELDRALPLGGPGISAALEQAGELVVREVLVGRFELDPALTDPAQRSGSCDGATHLVWGVDVGAFDLYSGVSAKGRAAASVAGAEVGGDVTSQRERLEEDGNVNACTAPPAAGTSGTPSPPPGCGAPLRLELRSLTGRAGQASRPACRERDAPDCERQCKAGEHRACTTFARYLRFGQYGARMDARRSIEMIAQECELGDVVACAVRGMDMFPGGALATDIGRGVQLVHRGCGAGFANACSALGQLYDQGLGVPQDDRRAAKLFEQACAGGHLRGCTLLGMAYAGTRGVPADQPRANALLERACAGGEATGCAQLGVRLAHGMGIGKDLVRALELLDRACKEGDAYACSQAGLFRRLEGKPR
jgi:TPR repeat protein